MQRHQDMTHQRHLAKLLLLGMALVLTSPAFAGGGGAVVSGVVRDAQGVAQMGALVQILGANSITVATAWAISVTFAPKVPRWRR